MGRNTLKRVWVFLALVGLVVAPTVISSGQATMTVLEKPTNRVLYEYDVFLIEILMSQSRTGLEQHVPQGWSEIHRHEEISSSLLTLQRKLEEHDVLETLIVLDTLPELLNDDLVRRAVLTTWTTLEDEEELLETHFGKKPSQKKRVVLTNGSFQSLLTQLKGEPSETDEVQTPLYSANSPGKVVIMDGVPQVLRFQELQKLFGDFVETTLLYQQELFKQKPPLTRRVNGQSESPAVNVKEEAATKSKVVLTKAAFLSLLRQVKLDTLQDEGHKSSDSLDVEVSASKVGMSKGTMSPVMLQREFLSRLVSQTMNILHRQSPLQDQLMFVGGLLDRAFPQILEETESPRKLITPLMHQREFLGNILSQTINTLFGGSGVQEQLKMWDALLGLAFQEHLEKSDSPSKLITPLMHQREFLGKILPQIMNTLNGGSGLEGQLKVLPESLEESPSKSVTPMLHREFLRKIISQTVNTLYEEYGLQEQLKMWDAILNFQEHLERTDSPSTLITPFMHEREFLSKILLRTMSTLYGELGLKDQLKFFDGELEQDFPESLEKSPSKVSTPMMDQRLFLSDLLAFGINYICGSLGFQYMLKMQLEPAGKTKSPSRLISPGMHQREFLSKLLSQTMSKLYGESRLKDQLKMLDGEDLSSQELPDKKESPIKLISPMDQTKYTIAPSQIFDHLKQDSWLIQETRRETTLQGLISAAGVKSSASPSSCNYKETQQVVQLYTDSCYKRSGSFTQRMAGLGGLWYDKLKYHVFSTAYSNPHKLHNNDLEMLSIFVALKLYGRGWQGMNVEAYCDNESTVKLLNAYCDDTSLNFVKCNTRARKRKSSKIQTFIINKINEEVCKYKFSLSTIQIGGKQNCRADTLSRSGIEEFSSHLPRNARYCEYDVMVELHSFDQSLESWMKTL